MKREPGDEELDAMLDVLRLRHTDQEMDAIARRIVAHAVTHPQQARHQPAQAAPPAERRADTAQSGWLQWLFYGLRKGLVPAGGFAASLGLAFMLGLGVDRGLADESRGVTEMDVASLVFAIDTFEAAGGDFQ